MSASAAEGFNGCSFRSDGRPPLSGGEAKASERSLRASPALLSEHGEAYLWKKACEEQPSES